MAKQTHGRRSHDDLLARICELVTLANLRQCPTRAGLAERWKCTPRNVSHIIDTARRLYCVRISHDPDVAGYVLDDAGLFDLEAIERNIP